MSSREYATQHDKVHYSYEVASTEVETFSYESTMS